MNFLRELNFCSSRVKLMLYLLFLAISVKCKSSVYIQPTFSTEKPQPRIPGELYPRMIIIYMDKTIWPFWFELDVTRPIEKKNELIETVQGLLMGGLLSRMYIPGNIEDMALNKGAVTTSLLELSLTHGVFIVLDAGFQPLKPFQQVPALLASLQEKGYRLALINQSPDEESIEKLLDWFDLSKHLTHKMSMHAPKKDLVRMISQKYNISYGDMLYLDAEYEDIPEVAELQTVCIQTGDKGVTMEDVEKGLHIFSTVAPDY